MNHELIHFSSPQILARAAAQHWLDELALLSQQDRPLGVALSGGRITQTFFNEVVDIARKRPLNWDNCHFFWADERCVPPEDAESNFKLANELLLKPLQIKPHCIHRLRGEANPAETAAAACAELASVLPTAGGAMSQLDWVFLGMGEDGHVASLFPNTPRDLWQSPDAFIVVTDSPKPPPIRLSLSLAAIAAARQVWVLASGTGKTPALQASLAPNGNTPLARVIKVRSASRIYTDLPGV